MAYRPKVCPRCSSEFVPSGAHQVYCELDSAHVRARVRRQAREAGAPRPAPVRSGTRTFLEGRNLIARGVQMVREAGFSQRAEIVWSEVERLLPVGLAGGSE